MLQVIRHFFDTSKLKTEVPYGFVLDFSLGYGAFFTACQLVAYVMGRFYSDAFRSVMKLSDKGYRAALVHMVLGEVNSFVNDINLYFSFLLDFLYSDSHDFNKWWVDFEFNFCSNKSRLSGGSISVESVMDDLFSEFSGEVMGVRYGFNTEYFQKMFKLHQEGIRKIVGSILIDEYKLISSSGFVYGPVDVPVHGVYGISDSEVTRR